MEPRRIARSCVSYVMILRGYGQTVMGENEFLLVGVFAGEVGRTNCKVLIDGFFFVVSYPSKKHKLDAVRFSGSLNPHRHRES